MAGRVARIQECDDTGCDVAHLLVRGTNVSFISVEAVRYYVKQYGELPMKEAKNGGMTTDETKVHADIVIDSSFVLVHDTNAALLNRCELYILKWRTRGARDARSMHPDDKKAALSYFGPRTRQQHGSVEIPEGPWQRLAQVAFIRYTRQGQHAAKYEHQFEPHAWIHDCHRPLSWKLKLPDGCVVDDRGFVDP